MNKKQLKPGMVVETRDGELRIFIGDVFYKISDYQTYLSLDNYNDDLYYSTKVFNSFDIMKVYKDSEIIYGQDIEPIWIRDEVDWSKVPKDTLVEVSLYSNMDDSVIRYFAKYIEETGQIACYNDGRTSKTTKHMSTWTYGRIIEMPKQEGEEVSYEKIQDKFNTFCRSGDCEKCKYYWDYDSCELGWIIDNYNVTKKED